MASPSTPSRRPAFPPPPPTFSPPAFLRSSSSDEMSISSSTSLPRTALAAAFISSFRSSSSRLCRSFCRFFIRRFWRAADDLAPPPPFLAPPAPEVEEALPSPPDQREERVERADRAPSIWLLGAELELDFPGGLDGCGCCCCCGFFTFSWEGTLSTFFLPPSTALFCAVSTPALGGSCRWFCVRWDGGGAAPPPDPCRRIGDGCGGDGEDSGFCCGGGCRLGPPSPPPPSDNCRSPGRGGWGVQSGRGPWPGAHDKGGCAGEGLYGGGDVEEALEEDVDVCLPRRETSAGRGGCGEDEARLPEEDEDEFRFLEVLPDG